MAADSGLAALQVPVEKIVAPGTVGQRGHQKTDNQRTLIVV